MYFGKPGDFDQDFRWQRYFGKPKSDRWKAQTFGRYHDHNQ